MRLPTGRRSRRRRWYRSTVRSLAHTWVAVLVLVAFPPASPAATASAPAWTISSTHYPTNFGESGAQPRYLLTVINAGGASTDGSAITITDTLPAGLTATSVNVPTVPTQVFTNLTSSCTTAPAQCTFSGSLPPGAPLQVEVDVQIEPSASGTVTNTANVSGGGAASATTTDPTTISSTPPAFGIQSFGAAFTNADGSPDTQAGSHPDALTTFFNLTTSHDVPIGVAKDIHVDLPPGVIGNPEAVPRCPQRLYPGCPPDTQIGIVLGSAEGGHVASALYNMVPPPGKTADFEFNAAGEDVQLISKVRTDGDYGISTVVDSLNGQHGPIQTYVTVWGVPADPSHDPLRLNPTTNSFGASTGLAPVPLLTMPASCGGPLTVSISIDTWQHPGQFSTATSTMPSGMSGCDQLPGFDPVLSVTPDVSQADTPSGYAIDLHMPLGGLLDPSGLAAPLLRDATVTLPAGVAVSPGEADGLGACPDSQTGIGTTGPPSCPDSSKLGTIEITTPLLADKLEGSIYLRQSSPPNFRLLLAASGDGVNLKLAGDAIADPATGQVRTTFDQNPQLPFSELRLQFNGGPRAPLVNPPTCGTFLTGSLFAAWSSPFTPDAALDSPLTIDQGCGQAGGFSPSLDAGVVNPVAGGSSAFTLTLSRESGQNVSGLDVILPPGLLAKLAGVPLCPDAQAAAGDCGTASQIGHATVAVGPGSSPLYIPQPGKAPTAVYLAGPYKGAPFSLVIKVPAQAGPFDLGTVTVRAALYIDPTDARVTVKSDPLPQILDGIPLEYRKINVTIDRAGFIQSPTSCNPMQVTADVNGAPLGGPVSVNSAGAGFTTARGLSARVSNRFQVGGCQELGFSPRLEMRLSGRGRTRSGDHPALTATLTQGLGQAHLRSARVALPLSLALDPGNSQHVCPYAVAQAVHGGPVGCPADTVVGEARAVTPLLDHPLAGRVYLVQGVRFNRQHQAIRTLPSLLVALRGQIALDLRAQSAVDGAGRLVTTFGSIPDAAVSKFTLTINGGPRGILVITGTGESICTAAQTALVRLGAQSGKIQRLRPKLAAPACGKGGRHGGRRRKHGARRGRAAMDARRVRRDR